MDIQGGEETHLRDCKLGLLWMIFGIRAIEEGDRGLLERSKTTKFANRSVWKEIERLLGRRRKNYGKRFNHTEFWRKLCDSRVDN